MVELRTRVFFVVPHYWGCTREPSSWALSPNGQLLAIASKAPHTLTTFETRTFHQLDQMSLEEAPERVDFLSSNSEVAVMLALGKGLMVWSQTKKQLS